jgi:hypothetical protein
LEMFAEGSGVGLSGGGFCFDGGGESHLLG